MYYSNQQLKRFWHMSATNCVIHICRNALPASEVLDHVEYMGFHDTANALSRFQTWIVMCNGFLLPKFIYQNYLTMCGIDVVSCAKVSES